MIEGQRQILILPVGDRKYSGYLSQINLLEFMLAIEEAISLYFSLWGKSENNPFMANGGYGQID